MDNQKMGVGDIIYVDSYVMKNENDVDYGSCPNPETIDIVSYDTVGVHQSPVTTGNGTSPDDLGDANDRVVQEAKKAKLLITRIAPIQPDDCIPAHMKNNCHVIETDDAVYDAMLTRANVEYNTNEFYVIQVLKSNSESLYTVYNRWGTVGETGETMLSGPHFFHAAISEFEEKFYQKTQNHWSDRKNFVSYPRCYTWLEIEYKRKDHVEPILSVSAVGKRTFGPRVAKFMSLICDFSIMTEEMMDIGYDAKELPIQNLSNSTILKAYDVLKLIAEVIGENNRMLLEELSGEFYTVIPHVFGNNRLCDFVIDTPEKLRTKLEMVEALGEIENATKLFGKCAVGNKDDILFAQYQFLRCTLAPVSPTTKAYQLIEQYVQYTSGYSPPDIVEIFKVSREGENERFQKYANLKNRMLLWHGSRLTNWMGILSEGLRIAPQHVPLTGSSLGRGIYFADMFVKSTSYIHARHVGSPKSQTGATTTAPRTGMLLLCEVALGEMQELNCVNYKAHLLPPGKLSIKGLGVTAPSKFEVLDDGVIIPTGKEVKQELQGFGRAYNEYVVYNEDQVKMRYLVQVEYRR